MSPRARRAILAALVVPALVLTSVLAACGAYESGWDPRPDGRVSAEPTAAARRMGIVLGHMSTWATDASLARDLDSIVAAGATWVSIPVDWPSIEVDPGRFQWDDYGTGGLDRTVRMARERGLEVFGVVAYSPPWARAAGCGNDKCPPVDPARFADFARRAAQRYAPQGVRTWQIWNEPNNFNAWAPEPDVSAYTELLKDSYAAIKQADPGATVVAAGLSPGSTQPDGRRISPLDFLDGIYANGGGGSFDALGHHPYSFNGGSHPLDGHPLNAYTQTVFLHERMAANGDGAKRIWGSESGAPTGTSTDAVTESRQAQLLGEYFKGWQGTLRFKRLDETTGQVDLPSITGPLFTYETRDGGDDQGDREDNFGLQRADGSPKPAFEKFCRLASGPSCVATATDPPAAPAEAPPGSGSGAGDPAPAMAVKSAGIGRSVAAHPGGGYYVLRGDGRIEAYGGAPSYGSPDFGWDIARDIAVMPGGDGYAVLDGWGGVHKYGSARGLPAARTYWPGWDIARSIAVAPGGDGYVVLDGWGGIHASGTLRPKGLPFWKGWDIARQIAVTEGGDTYVLDGFGGIHAATGSSRVGALGSPYWRGRDVARDLVVASGGSGTAVLDGHGTVHTRGDAPRIGGTQIRDARAPWRGLAIAGRSYVVVRG